MALKPLSYEDPLDQLLRDGKIKTSISASLRARPANRRPAISAISNLRGLDAAGIDLSNCYFRAADLPGIDFSNARLEGASINGARISAPFSPPLTADEVMLWANHGTRMRHKK
jgi:uncharacterized protein YjbI with pentapeptide repeats